jgi:hypothetical protein
MRIFPAKNENHKKDWLSIPLRLEVASIATQVIFPSSPHMIPKSAFATLVPKNIPENPGFFGILLYLKPHKKHSQDFLA